MRRDRLLLLALAATALGPGAWALVLPASFHRDFPGAGLRWVAPLGPYDEHLVRDVGGFLLALAVLALLAAARPRPELVRTTAVVWLVFLVPHLLVHLHLGPSTEASGAAQLAVLAAQLLLPVALLVGSRRQRRTTAAGGVDA